LTKTRNMQKSSIRVQTLLWIFLHDFYVHALRRLLSSTHLNQISPEGLLLEPPRATTSALYLHRKVQTLLDERQQDWLPLGASSLFSSREPFNRLPHIRHHEQTSVYLTLLPCTWRKELRKYIDHKSRFFVSSVELREMLFTSAASIALFSLRQAGFCFRGGPLFHARVARFRLSAPKIYTDSLSHPMQFGHPEVETYPSFPCSPFFVKVPVFAPGKRQRTLLLQRRRSPTERVQVFIGLWWCRLHHQSYPKRSIKNKVTSHRRRVLSSMPAPAPTAETLEGCLST
jgi:hypothetical protein